MSALARRVKPNSDKFTTFDLYLVKSGRETTILPTVQVTNMEATLVAPWVNNNNNSSQVTYLNTIVH